MRIIPFAFLWPLAVLSCLVVLEGCPTISSPENWASRAIGKPIEPLLKAVDRDHVRDPKDEPSREELMKNRRVLENGNVVYVIPVNFKRCNVHWEVNPAGIIVGYRYEPLIKGGCDW